MVVHGERLLWQRSLLGHPGKYGLQQVEGAGVRGHATAAIDERHERGAVLSRELIREVLERRCMVRF